MITKLYQRNKKGSMPLFFILLGAFLFSSYFAQAQKAMENLGRGVVAVRTNTSNVMVSWRMLGTDPSSIGFNVYRGATKLNATPITTLTSYNDNITTNDTYSIKPVIGGVEGAASPTVSVWAQNYLSIPLQTLAGHTPNDASVGDLDGDGEYEIVLKQEMIPMDPANAGTSGQTKLEAYKLNGTLLWRINLGINIREGAHYTPFLVYDFNSDGRAEVVSRTSEGTVDGIGVTIGDVNADGITDYRGADGRILTGPEFFSVFDGLTGKELARANYIPRGNICDWGADCYGNRVDRFLMGVGYFDGKQPSILICRGYYGKSVLQAWDWRSNVLSTRWTFDTTVPANAAYAGQGNHNLTISDVDNDGKDEVIYGAMAVNDDGTGLHNTGLGHGDALHVSDLDPTRAGMEVLDIREWNNPAKGLHMRDASTGTILWSKDCTAPLSEEGPGRSLSLDVDPRYAGFESWCLGGGIPGMFDAKGNLISSTVPSTNFGIYWDGDLLSEVLNGNKLDKWNHLAGTSTRLLSAYNVAGAAENNGTKANACLTADILGDWREEIIFRHWDNQSLILFTTTIPTTYRFYTPMHDPHYRASVAVENVGYNQPPHLGYFFGDGMATPPTPNIVPVRGNATIADGFYIIKPVHSGLCIQGGTNATQQTCITSTTQKFALTKVGDNYELKNVSSNTYLNYANTNNSTFMTFTSGTTNRQFTIQHAGNNQFYIGFPGVTARTIEMQANDLTLGRKMVVWDMWGGNNQKFTFTSTTGTRTIADSFEDEPVTSVNSSEEVSATPNPSNGAFKIRAKGAFTYVINDSFKNAHEKGNGKDEASVGANLKPGLYIIKVQTLKGNSTIKLIKQ